MSLNMNENDIAIIGLAAQFPKSGDIHAFWENLKAGNNLISYFSIEELVEAGHERRSLELPEYVRAKGLLSDIEMFDFEFFKFSQMEANITDPQHRVLLETTWKALENAGCCEEREGERFGVYATCNTTNSYLYMHLYNNPNILETFGGYQLSLHNNPEFLATRLSYTLNFTGPSLLIHSACSSSIATVHQACQGLINYSCDVAIAAAVNWSSPHKAGYLYQNGMILSPDGVCRPFDKDAAGTVPGDGVGVVILKRLSDAIQDRNHIYAVVKGVSINNDGAEKMSFASPSVAGQAQAISDALAIANVEVDDIDYIETHGTATHLGDPIEIIALQELYQKRKKQKPLCVLGSVKSNMGHLDVAAGMAGLIKTILVLHHREIPPTIHFKTFNSNIDFSHVNFEINTAIKTWPEDAKARCAAVSSFGVGGTNTHIILEEYKSYRNLGNKVESYLFPISALGENALREMISNLILFLRENESIPIDDVAYTLQVGRKQLANRRCFLARNKAELIEKLEACLTTAHLDDNSSLDAKNQNEKISLLSENFINFFESFDLQKQDLVKGNDPNNSSRAALFIKSWENGINFNFIAANKAIASTNHIVLLPTYPFQKKSCWILPTKKITPVQEKVTFEDWYTAPVWALSPLVSSVEKNIKNVLLVSELYSDVETFVNELKLLSINVKVVSHGIFSVHDREDHSLLDIHSEVEWLEFSKKLLSLHWVPDHILYFLEPSEINYNYGYHQILKFFKGVHKYWDSKLCQLFIITSQLYALESQEWIHQNLSTVEGFSTVLSQEFPMWLCKLINIRKTASHPWAKCLLNEMMNINNDYKICYLNENRYALEYKIVNPVYQDSKNPIIHAGGTYYITGGLGNLGLIMAEYLAKHANCNIILVGRTDFPARDTWLSIINDPKSNVKLKNQLNTIKKIEGLGSQVYIEKLDISEQQEVEQSMCLLKEKGLIIRGIIHAAGNVNANSMLGINEINSSNTDLHFNAKITGLDNLIRFADIDQLDFFICMSSLATSLGGVHYSCYSAANNYLNAVASNHYKGKKTRWLSINWDGWLYDNQQDSAEYSILKKVLITPEEGFRVLDDIFCFSFGPIVNVSKRNFHNRLSLWKQGAGSLFFSRKPSNSFSKSFPVILNDIQGYWKEALGLTDPSNDSDFHSLGGDSLMAIQLSEKISKDYEIQFLPNHFLMNHTINKQAIFIAKLLGVSMEEFVA